MTTEKMIGKLSRIENYLTDKELEATIDNWFETGLITLEQAELAYYNYFYAYR